jgi:hypothetical protein
MNIWSILSMVACVAIAEEKVDTRKAHFAYILHPRKQRGLVVIPEINGDLKRLVTLIYQAKLSIDNYKGTPESLMKELQKSSESLNNLSKSVVPVEARVTLVVMGNVGNANSKDTNDCYSILFGVEKAFGWRVIPIFGSYEMGLVHPSIAQAVDKTDLVYLILSRFVLVVHVYGPPIQTNGFFGLHSSNTFIAHGDIDQFPSETMIARFGNRPAWFDSYRELSSPRDGEVCQDAVYKITSLFRSGRIISTNRFLSNKKVDWSSRCGSRLVSLSPQSDSVFIQTFNPVTITRVGLQSSSRIWPLTDVAGTRKVANIKLDRFDYLVVIPDIHGDLQGFAKTLWLAYKRVTKTSMSMDTFIQLVLYEKPHKAARKLRAYPNRIKAIFLGDYVDRGPYSKECIELLLRIDYLFGWSVVALYGNHEYMNLHRGAYPYINKEDKLSGPKRDFEFSIEGSLWKQMTSKLVLAARTVGPNGRYLFVHASMDPSWFNANHELLRMLDGSPTRIDDINNFNRFISEQSPDLTHILTEADSPIWSRSLESMSDDELCKKHLPSLLDLWKVDRIIVGHNPQALRRVVKRCDDRVLLADVGISGWVFNDRGNPMAIVEDLRSRASKGTMEAIYLDRTETIA